MYNLTLTPFYWLASLLLQIVALPLSAAPNFNQAADSTTVLHAAIPEIQPWGYRENNQIKGIEYDIFQSISQEMGVTLNSHLTPDRRRMALVTAGDADVTSITLSSDEQATYPKTLLIDEQPLYQLLIAVITLKGQALQVTSMADLYRYHVGHLRVPIELENAVLPDHPRRMRFNTTSSMLKSLLRGRVEIVLSAPAELWIPAQKLGVENRLHLVYKFSYIAIHSAWSSKGLLEKQPKIRQQFNIAAEKLRREGKIAGILKRYSKLEYFRDYGAEPPGDLVEQ